VSGGDELHVMARFRPGRRDTADLDLAVIGMRAERDDPEFAVIGPRRRDGIPGRDLLSHDARNLRWHERHDARAAGDEPTYEYEHATARHGLALPANGSDPGVASGARVRAPRRREKVYPNGAPSRGKEHCPRRLTSTRTSRMLQAGCPRGALENATRRGEV